MMFMLLFFFFFSSRRRHTRSCLVSWARRCVQETGINAEYMGILFEHTHLYKFPHCTIDQSHSSYQLNELCLEPGCKDCLVPLCACCMFDRHKQQKNHEVKPIKIVFNELIAELETKYNSFEQYKTSGDETEQELEKMQNELKGLENLAKDMQEHLKLYVEKYRKTMRKEPYERVAIRRILKELLKNGEQEDVLRDKMLELGQYVRIEEGVLKVNDIASVDKWNEQVKNAKSYIAEVREPLNHMVDLKSNLEKTLQNYALGEDENQSDNEEDKQDKFFEPSNIAELSKSKFETKIKDKLTKKQELEMKKETLKKQMDLHIESCENKHCSFVDIPYKIKWWKTLWFKQNTECIEGKKLNLEMEQILNEIKKIDKLKVKQTTSQIPPQQQPQQQQK
eukprot:TRINITY_DN4674_c0_g1_i1.p1 TRINITY_DN4674_c0_g1~~TRINITY_DN4674_c0_g1_i1.p1  ORF type:complete len:394 (+),score=85.65 TRINITY_DN4674_c0_g1_i1:43-1224(+)